MSLTSTSPILLADDDPTTCKLIQFLCEKNGIKAEAYSTGDKLLESIHEETLLTLIDLKMPGTDGVSCLRRIKKDYPLCEVIILTAVNEAREAVSALRLGAFDYFTKPFEAEELLLAIQNALRLSAANREKEALQQAVGFAQPISDFVAESKRAQQLLEEAHRVASINATILIQGESGTGKSVLARTIHRLSPRANGPFISVNCPALPRELIESEMFGHEKGSFTGAHQRRIGRTELADGGTLFLDEIADLPLDLQPKLLTFLQEKSFQRIGGSKEIPSDVRVIAATNQDLKAKVGLGQFREDLFFRLSVVPIVTPPLRERREDIPALIQHILQRIVRDRECEPLTLEPEAQQTLQVYTWPGNIRELENTLERASAFCRNETITLKDLPPSLQPNTSEQKINIESLHLENLSLDTLERLAIKQTLTFYQGNKSRAARALGITEKSIYNKIKRLKLHQELPPPLKKKKPLRAS